MAVSVTRFEQESLRFEIPDTYPLLAFTGSSMALDQILWMNTVERGHGQKQYVRGADGFCSVVEIGE